MIRPLERTVASVPSSVASISITPAEVAGSMLAARRTPRPGGSRLEDRSAHHDASADRRRCQCRVQTDVGGGPEVQRAGVLGHLDVLAGLAESARRSRSSCRTRRRPWWRGRRTAALPTALRGAIRRWRCRSSRAFPRACRSLESGLHRLRPTAPRCDPDGACRPPGSCRGLQPSRRQCPK